MISIVLSWLIIFVFSYILGCFFLQILYGSKGPYSVDECIWSGIAMLTVYAEAFSIFHRVSDKAVIVLAILVVICALYLIFLQGYGKGFFGRSLSILKKIPILKWSIIIAAFLTIVVWTDVVPQNYDTYLYHVQAIQWIEQYGVVKGLGNLHSRFAFNSAFLPLQTLFDLRFIAGQSLHTVNGFCAAFMLIYSISTNSIWDNRRFTASDWMKMGVLVYTYYARKLLSSPGTDTMPMYLFLYIAIKWHENIHEDRDRVFAWLCLLAAFNITLKLSVASLLVLFVLPVYRYINKRRWKEILKHIGVCLLIGLPWLVRNILISGYLAYPYTVLDVFDVDWKVPVSVATMERWEISAWARGSLDPFLHGEGFFEWFPEKWMTSYSALFDRICMFGGIIAAVSLIIYMIIHVKKHIIKPAELTLWIAILISFAIWLYTAPDMRFGVASVLIIMALFMDRTITTERMILMQVAKSVRVLVCILLILMMSSVFSVWDTMAGLPFVIQQDYNQIDTELYEGDGFVVYCPLENTDLCGTDVFPSAPYRDMIDKIELRGSGLKDGFRLKAEFKGQQFNNSGAFY